MADDAKAKAEKLAAAKKKLEARKKALAKKSNKKEASDAPETPTAENSAAAATTKADEASAEQEEVPNPTEDAAVESDDKAEQDEKHDIVETTALPSLAQQSKARSASFRKPSVSGPLSPGLFNPEGDTAPEIYRKQVGRIEELEKENKRLAKEAAETEKRRQKAEDELERLRDVDGDGKKAGSSEETEKLRSEVTALQRQNAQLQAQLSRSTTAGAANRHGSSPSISGAGPSELEAQLQSKSATIESMELEMSRLRAQVERLSVSAATPSEQLAALEDKLARAEKAAALSQRELADLKRNLERTSEQAVREGGARASAETQLRALQREATEAAAARDEHARRADGLDKKVATLQTLHKEHDARAQALRRDKEQLAKDLERAEAEAARLRKKDAADGGGDDDAVDELENEGRARLERRVRELEAENTDLRRGIWHERRKEMQLGPDEAGGRTFETVDLGGPQSPSLRKTPATGTGGGLGDFFTTGLNVLTGGGTAAPHGPGHGHGDHDSLLGDEEFEFDEDAFRRAQEDDQKKRIERIKELKRTLKNWEGWRLDLVENRRGGGEGIGEIFEI